MNAELLLIPSAGQASESKATLTEWLTTRGVRMTDVVVLPAEPRELNQALRVAVGRSDLIVVCGGIGFAPEDIAVATVCAAIGAATRQDAGVLSRLKAAYPERTDFGAAALLPEEGTLLTDEATPFAGGAMSAGNQTILLLPDEPAALAALLRRAVPACLNLDRGFFVADEETGPFQPREAEFYEEGEEPEETDADKPAPAQEDADALFAPVEPPKAPAPPPAPLADPATEWDVDALTARAVDEPAAAQADEPLDEADEDKPAEKDGFLKSTLRFFIPWKGDGLVDIVRKVVFMLAVVGIVVSGAYIYDYFAAKLRNDAILSEARGMYDQTDTTVNKKTGTLNRFSGLLSQNKDCRGWISIPNTDINNPVYQTTDNDYYLHHDATGRENVYGAVFADYRDTISAEGNSANITLYGHHMRDGSMFADLHSYKSMNFYKENPIVTFDTIYGGGGAYKIFACFLTNAEAKDDNGYFFDYTVPTFESEEAFTTWIEQIRRRSLYITPVDVQPGDEILTLSTCTYELKDVEMRCVVVARKVRADEAARVNVTEVSANPKVIYPAVWYAMKGGAKPVYEDGLTTWLAQPDYEKYLQQQEELANASSEQTASEETPSEEAPSEVTPSTEPPVTSETPAPSTEPPVSTEATPTTSDAPTD